MSSVSPLQYHRDSIRVRVCSLYSQWDENREAENPIIGWNNSCSHIFKGPREISNWGSDIFLKKGDNVEQF